MVFAKSKLTIEEDILKPENKATIRIATNNPKRVYDEFGDLLAGSFATPQSGIQEKSFSWDQKENFAVTYEMEKDFDDLSYLYIKIKLKGAKTDQGGFIEVEIEPFIRTEYPQDTIWQKTLFYEIGRMLADRIFYEKKRMEYMAEIRRLLREFDRRLKELARQA